MVIILSDTTPAVQAVLVDMLRRATPARKLEMTAQLNATVRTLALVGLQRRHPQADEAELQRRLADLLLGPELATRAYGPLQAGDNDDQ